MKSFTHTNRNVRLFAEESFEGWMAGIYDLDKHEWIEKTGPHFDADSAKRGAIMRAEAYLREPIPSFRWLEDGKIQEEESVREWVSTTHRRE